MIPLNKRIFTEQSGSKTTILSSSIAGKVQIPIINDSIAEEDETFTVTLSGVTGAVFAENQSNVIVQVTIIDDEGLPVLSIDSTTINVNEQDGYAEIGLSLSFATTKPITITYSTVQNSASDALDFINQTDSTYEIFSGTTGKIFIPISDDSVYEGSEEFSVIISAISGAAYDLEVISTSISITITDDDTEPTLTISAYTCEYAEAIPANFSIIESIGSLIFNAKLSHPSKTPISFNFTATADTATSADFYAISTTQFTIQPGSLCTEIVTPITNDELYEPDEQFEVEFNSESGANIIAPFKVKIKDDDITKWSIEDLAMKEGDSDSASDMAFRVNLSSPPFETVRVKWTALTATGNSAVLKEDYAPDHNSHTGYISIPAGQTSGYIDGLEITGDLIFEPDETFTVILSNPDQGTLIGDGVAIGTIINDDPEPKLSVSTTTQVSGN